MISDRHIWIYREIYSEIEKKCNYDFSKIPKELSKKEVWSLAQEQHKKKNIGINFKTKIIKKALEYFYNNELNLKDYETIKHLDLIQRIARVEATNKRKIIIQTDDERFESANEALPKHIPELRCPKRTEDRSNPELFHYIETPSDLKPIENGQLFIDWMQHEKKALLHKGYNNEKIKLN